jgi:hypothetical protein
VIVVVGILANERGESGERSELCAKSEPSEQSEWREPSVLNERDTGELIRRGGETTLDKMLDMYE